MGAWFKVSEPPEATVKIVPDPEEPKVNVPEETSGAVVLEVPLRVPRVAPVPRPVTAVPVFKVSPPDCTVRVFRTGGATVGTTVVFKAPLRVTTLAPLPRPVTEPPVLSVSPPVVMIGLLPEFSVKVPPDVELFTL